MESKKEVKLRHPHWTERRVFVRELKGKYEELYKKIYEAPRVYKTKGVPFDGGPVLFEKDGIRPFTTEVCQSIETHFVCLAPGGRSQKHGHMNSAVVYVLEGKGHDIHDGERLDWEAGDAYVIKDGCVHQHFNDDPSRPALAVIFKAKPLFMFFNLLFQRNVEFPPDKPLPGWEGWRPPY
jgi:gentisate 1,2-dioxygenase